MEFYEFILKIGHYNFQNLFELVRVDVLDHLGDDLGVELLDGHLLANVLQSLLSLEHGPEDVGSEKKKDYSTIKEKLIARSGARTLDR